MWPFTEKTEAEKRKEAEEERKEKEIEDNPYLSKHFNTPEEFRKWLNDDIGDEDGGWIDYGGGVANIFIVKDDIINGFTVIYMRW